MRHFVRGILSGFSKQLQNKNSVSTVLLSCSTTIQPQFPE